MTDVHSSHSYRLDRKNGEYVFAKRESIGAVATQSRNVSVVRNANVRPLIRPRRRQNYKKVYLVV